MIWYTGFLFEREDEDQVQVVKLIYGFIFMERGFWDCIFDLVVVCISSRLTDTARMLDTNL